MKRSTFGSKFGTMAAIGGSVIGLGNIWRFPYVAGENGGAAFILVYLGVSLLISIPVMMSEMTLGRLSRRNAFRTFKKLGRGKGRAWTGLGLLGIATAFTILAFYSVIAGWAIEMLRESFTGEYMHLDSGGIKANFDAFVATGWQPAIMTFVFIGITALVVSFGIEKGIERFNKVVMPMLAVVLVFICINSATLDGFREGAAFLLSPDWGKVNGSTVLKALGQSFFSLSLGMGTIITYGSYIKKKENMFRIAGTIAFSDLTVAVLAGLAIFPAVFTFGISPTSGPDLVFLTLPNIFAQMGGGQVIGVLFFFLLFAAAITSSVSLLEVIVAFATEELRIKRRKATFVIAAIGFALSMLCVVSQMPEPAISAFGMDFLTLFDSATSLYMMPIGALLIVIFTGWVMDRKKLGGEMTTGGTYGTVLFRLIYPMIRFVIPVFIALLFLNQLGFIK